MAEGQPHIIVLAGPNGAGKSTTAPTLLRDALTVDEFVNADTIAQGLCAFAPETVALEAGRITLKRLNELAAKRVNFAFETTLASRSFAPWLEKLALVGYHSHLIFLALPKAELALERVANRVALGGHNIPDLVVRRRFAAGLKNFFQLYQPIVTSWSLYDNSLPIKPLRVAEKTAVGRLDITRQTTYDQLLEVYSRDQ
ncbi:MAG: zeta toxin family protein [Deltaproteobacteria bacterium]|jgi:predicted ABC-type ATPase|nr:zeta toxin family protein [Deltaproteobacteria bacterium]